MSFVLNIVLVSVPRLSYRIATRTKKVQILSSTSSHWVCTAFLFEVKVEMWLKASEKPVSPPQVHHFLFMFSNIQVLLLFLGGTSIIIMQKLSEESPKSTPEQKVSLYPVTLTSFYSSDLCSRFTNFSKCSWAIWLWLKTTDTLRPNSRGHLDISNESSCCARCTSHCCEQVGDALDNWT